MSLSHIYHTFDPQDDSLLLTRDSAAGDVAVFSGEGDLALRLLSSTVGTVHVVSPRLESYNLLVLKYTAMRNLVQDNVYNLLGVHPSGRRVFVYHQLRNALPKISREWWDINEDWIRTGILGSGQYEIQYRKWFHHLETLIGGWPVHKSLEEQTHFLDWLQERKRWAILNTVTRKSWLNEWKKALSHTLLHQNLYANLKTNSSENLRWGPWSLTLSGMKCIQEDSSSMQLHFQEPLQWLLTCEDHSLALIVLSSNELKTSELITEIQRKLLPQGRVILWSRIKPTYPEFNWNRSTKNDRSFYCGSLWEGTIEAE